MGSYSQTITCGWNTRNYSTASTSMSANRGQYMWTSRKAQSYGEDIYYFGYMEFTIPSYPHMIINKATLYMYQTVQNTHLTNIHLMTAASQWSSNQTGRQWWSANKNNILATAAGTFGGGSSYQTGYNRWVSVDVTSLITSARGMSPAVFTIWPDSDSIKSGSKYEQFYGTNATGYVPYIVVEYSDIVPNTPTIVSPSGDVLDKTNAQDFVWTYSDAEGGTQAKYEFGWRVQGSGDEWTTTTVTSSTSTHTADTSQWTAGIIEWRVRTYNSQDTASAYATASFELVGNPVPPTLATISNDAIPTIEWVQSHTEASKMEYVIYDDDGNVVWSSGEMPTTSATSFKPNCILPNGTYTIQMRVASIYNLWSEWVGTTFTLDPTAPEQRTIDLKICGDYINIITTIPEEDPEEETEESDTVDDYILYRSEDGIAYIPIDRNATGQFIDATVQPGIVYTYFVRYHNGSYTDSNKLSGSIGFDGYRLSSMSDPTKSILLNRNLSRPYGEIKRSVVNDISYNAVSGQEYKVRESGIGQDEELSGSYYVSKAQVEELKEILQKNDVFIIRSRKQVMFCDATLDGISNAFHNKGYEVTISCTKVDYDDAVHFDW